jgi:oligoendopeptidase F
MNAPFKTPTDPFDAPVWDLTDLYGSREDARIEVDLEHTRGMVDELNGLQGQLVAARGEPAVVPA